MKSSENPLRGHRVSRGPTSTLLQAWGDTREHCFEEAVMALVDSFAQGIEDQVSPVSVPITLEPSNDDDLLGLLLDEIVYVGEVLGAVPVAVELSRTEDLGVTGFLETVPLAQVRLIAGLPRRLGAEGPSVERRGGRWYSEARLAAAS